MAEMRIAFTLPALGRPVCSIRGAAIYSCPLHEAGSCALSSGRCYVRVVFRTSCECDYLSCEPQASSVRLTRYLREFNKGQRRRSRLGSQRYEK
jgi:hypothetical protein